MMQFKYTVYLQIRHLISTIFVKISATGINNDCICRWINIKLLRSVCPISKLTYELHSSFIKGIEHIKPICRIFCFTFYDQFRNSIIFDIRYAIGLFHKRTKLIREIPFDQEIVVCFLCVVGSSFRFTLVRSTTGFSDRCLQFVL